MEEEKVPTEEALTMSAIVREEDKTPPTVQMYMSQEKLIQRFWLKRKMEMVGAGLSPKDFDAYHKAQAIEDAKLSYPRKGMYKVKEEIVEFIGKI